MNGVSGPLPQSGFTLPDGRTFVASGAAGSIAADLRSIAAFLQSVTPPGAIIRYEDWIEHDGLHFVRGSMGYPDLFAALGSTRDLLAASPQDADVCLGLAPEGGGWYLRARAEWSDEGDEVVARYDLTLALDTADRFRESLVQLRVTPTQYTAAEWFDRIRV